MNTTKQLILFTIHACLIFTLGCKKDKTSKSGVPELTTTEVTNILANTAVGGGTISGNGGETVTVSGICWSKVNPSPTTTDDTTKSSTSSGSFTAMLKNLSSSSTYYVRAYAINRVGIGYGNVITFNTGNAAPTATAVNVSGLPKGDEILTGAYTYNDSDGDAEGGTTFQWYMANDGAGAGETPIEGATQKTFRVSVLQEGKYIRFGVIPKAAAGNQIGVEVNSSFTTAVGDAATVTFMYKGAEVTYGIIVGPSGKKWLDRNLGANRVAQSVTDYLAFGDMFQWGRLADGHQLITRSNATDAGASGVNGVTNVHSLTDVPSTNAFITALPGKYDWRTMPNNNLWQGANGLNNPCPIGWRIATEAEWQAEGIDNLDEGFAKLKLTYTGWRNGDGVFEFTDSFGTYWSSTTTASASILIGFIPDYMAIETDRINGSACRCIRN